MRALVRHVCKSSADADSDSRPPDRFPIPIRDPRQVTIFPMITAYTDGGARGNPGPAGYGVHILDADGNTLAELVGPLGHATNNVAEYSGLIAALQWAVTTAIGACACAWTPNSSSSRCAASTRSSTRRCRNCTPTRSG